VPAAQPTLPWLYFPCFVVILRFHATWRAFTSTLSTLAASVRLPNIATGVGVRVLRCARVYYSQHNCRSCQASNAVRSLCYMSLHGQEFGQEKWATETALMACKENTLFDFVSSYSY
jgi:hypothetical protein